MIPEHEYAKEQCPPTRRRMQLMQVAPGLWAQLNGYQFMSRTVVDVEPVSEPVVLQGFSFRTHP